MQQPVTNGIGHGGVANVGMPVFNGTLAGNKGGSGLVAVFDHVQQVSLTFLVRGLELHCSACLDSSKTIFVPDAVDSTV